MGGTTFIGKIWSTNQFFGVFHARLCTSCLFGYRSHHCLKTLTLLLKFVSRETKESFVTKTNALLESTLISVCDVSVSIATVLSPQHKLRVKKNCPWTLKMMKSQVIEGKRKVERSSTFVLTRYLPYIASILFTRVKFTCTRTWILCSSGNPALPWRNGWATP